MIGAQYHYWDIACHIILQIPPTTGNSKKEHFTFHDERAARPVLAVALGNLTEVLWTSFFFFFLQLSMKASPVNQSQIWNFLDYLPPFSLYHSTNFSLIIYLKRHFNNISVKFYPWCYYFWIKKRKPRK